MAVAPVPGFAARPRLNPRLQTYAKARVAEFNQIPAERRAELRKLADYVRAQRAAGKPADLLFVCTHNSRRSHISQLWAQAASAYYGVANVRTWSGGTEATNFNVNAVAALERAGFDIRKTSEGSNPLYDVHYTVDGDGYKAFSKKYSDPVNPQDNFAVVMTCANADRSCPNVHGASLRIAAHYDDPKASDGTSRQNATYDDCVRQIAREMLYTFSLLRS